VSVFGFGLHTFSHAGGSNYTESVSAKSAEVGFEDEGQALEEGAVSADSGV
jgi:hypothetical protein